MIFKHCVPEGVVGRLKSDFLWKKGGFLRFSEGLGSDLLDLLDLEDLGATPPPPRLWSTEVVDVGVEELDAADAVAADSEKRRFLVPPLNMAFTSSHA